jgi:hypothetical protein
MHFKSPECQAHGFSCRVSQASVTLIDLVVSHNVRHVLERKQLDLHLPRTAPMSYLSKYFLHHSSDLSSYIFSSLQHSSRFSAIYLYFIYSAFQYSTLSKAAFPRHNQIVSPSFMLSVSNILFFGTLVIVSLIPNCHPAAIQQPSAIPNHAVAHNAYAECGVNSLNGDQGCLLNICCSYFGYCGVSILSTCGVVIDTLQTSTLYCTVVNSNADAVNQSPCQRGYGSCSPIPPPSCPANTHSASKGRKVGYYQAK